jgi:hypothetical protein
MSYKNIKLWEKMENIQYFLMDDKKVSPNLSFLLMKSQNESRNITHFNRKELFNFGIIAVHKNIICGIAVAFNNKSSIELEYINSERKNSEEKIGTNLLYLFCKVSSKKDFKNYELKARPEALEFYKKSGLTKVDKILGKDLYLIKDEIEQSTNRLENKLKRYNLELPELSLI